jgi:hypothetical protein
LGAEQIHGTLTRRMAAFACGQAESPTIIANGGDKTAIRQAQHSGAFPRAHPGAPPEWGCQRATLPKRISLNGRRQVRRSRFLRQKRIFEGTEERLPRRRGHCRSGATGRVRTLEEQAAQPMVNPSEMGQPSLDAAIASIASIAEYDQAFRSLFGRPPNVPDLLRAIASY